MNTARAAAAASTPTVKGGVYLDSFDARIIEYQFAIVKLETLIKHIKALQIKIRVQPDLIPLLQYIVIITGPLMNISDILAKRLDQVGRLVPITDQRKVAPSANLQALNFELDDQPVKETVKYDEKTKDLLPVLLGLYENALSLYQLKIKQSIIERDANRTPASNGKPIPLDLNSFKDILEPLELNVFSKLIIEPDEVNSYHFKRVPLVMDSINKAIKVQKDYVLQLQGFKAKQNDSVLKKLPHWNYTIHRVFASFVKLSELYTILRRFGRELYLPVEDHLRNPKILHNNVKLELSLNEADQFLKGTKKNQQIVFILAKGTRQGSYSHLKGSTIVELTNTLVPSLALITKMNASITNLVKNWELAESKLHKYEEEMKERERRSRVTSPTSPTDNATATKKLEVLFNPEREKLAQEAIAKQQRERERVALEERVAKEKADKERQLLEEQRAKKKFEERERQLREELTKDRDNSPSVSRQSSIKKTRVRSNSNSSVSSNSSSSSLNALNRDSTTSPRLTSPTSLSRTSSLQKRPASVYISSPAFDIRTQLRRQQAATAAAANTTGDSPVQTTGNRRRSQSLQSSLPSAQQNNTMLAAAAGAAALKPERHSSLKSKSEINHQESLQQKQQTLQVKNTTPIQRSPSPLKIKNPKNNGDQLPDIDELSLNDTPSKPKRGPLKSALASKRAEPHAPTPTQPATQPTSLAVPDLINETTSESSDSTVDNNNQNEEVGSRKSLETVRVEQIKSNEEDEEPKPIVKKVRFTGVPDEVEDVKPKRKGWIHPPKLQSPFSNGPNKPRSGLSAASDALRQERMIFHNIKRGELDVNTGSIVFPNTSNTRVMNTLAASTNNNHRLGKWRLGLNR